MKNQDYVREHYNKLVKGFDYEGYRWRKDLASKEQYKETKKSILFHFSPEKEILEIGPGPGTWTKLIINDSKKITLLDISKEMLNQAKQNISKKASFICSDFLDFKTKKKFDLIFSSRAIEYIEDKEKMAKKFKNILKNKGKILIITKNPFRRWRKILLKNKQDKLHDNWISIKDFRNLLEKNNFKNIRIYPVIFSCLPFQNFFLVRKLNSLMHNLFYKKQVSFFLLPFIESYLIKAER